MNRVSSRVIAAMLLSAFLTAADAQTYLQDIGIVACASDADCRSKCEALPEITQCEHAKIFRAVSFGTYPYASPSSAITWLLAYPISDSETADCIIAGDGTALPSDQACTAPPSISTNPANVLIPQGSGAKLSVSATSDAGDDLTYLWYMGFSGDTSHPLSSHMWYLYTGNLNTTTAFWMRVKSCGGTRDSSTAVVTTY